jgi:diguanylate cyclase (GGDEF)-like protein
LDTALPADPSAPSRLGRFAAGVARRVVPGAGARREPPPSTLDDGHQRALDSARHYRHLYYNAPVALLSADTHGTVLRWNEQAYALFGDRLVKGRVNTLPALLGEAASQRLLDEVAAVGRHRCELRTNSVGGGAERVCEVDASAVADAVELSFADVSDRSRLTDTLEHIAHHDVLTEQLNRRGLERAIDARLAQSGAAPVSLIYIDLDRFKAINDVFGHAVGDAVVIEAGRRLRAALPADGALGRMGGDEFVAMLPSHDLEAAHRLAFELVTALSWTPWVLEGLRLTVEASLGVIEAGAGVQTRELIALADNACAQSKRAGRGRITALRSDGELLGEYRAALRLGSALKTRLPVERLRLYAQPIVPLGDPLEPLSYEVLLRTVDEVGRVEPPGRLLAVAERHGGLAAIDRFVLEAAVRHLDEHPAFAARAGFFAVNVSGLSINDERFLRDAVALLRAHPVAASRLCLEITETVAIYDVNRARRFIDALKETGASIALDDFGAGYTSFAYLRHLPASLIKVDGQFVAGIDRDPRQRGIMRAIGRLAHELGMRCLAEWVEDVPTLRGLLALDVDYAQGFLFSHPRPLDAWLTEPVSLEPLHEARWLNAAVLAEGCA